MKKPFGLIGVEAPGQVQPEPAVCWCETCKLKPYGDNHLAAAQQ